jgi:hypothetical protein
MDNLDHDNLSAGDVLGTVLSIRETVIVKAKRKKAQKISDAGGYVTLTAYQKSLIPMPDYAKTQAQTVAAATGQAAAAVQQQLKDAPALDPQTGQLKKYAPYIIGAVVLFAVVYYVSK